MKRGTFFISVIFFINMAYSAQVFAEDKVKCVSTSLNQELNKFNLVNKLKVYFSNYYELIFNDKFISPEDVLSDIKEIILNIEMEENSLGEEFSKIDDFFELNQRINEHLDKNNLVVNMFVLLESNIVNCWLGERLTVAKDSKEIQGRRYEYQLIVIDKLLIHDYLYYAINGQEQFAIGTQGNLIFCNRESFRQKAEQRWGFLLSRHNSERIHNYNPSKVDKLRRNLQCLAWKNIFLETIEKNGADKGREIFISIAMEKLLEIAIFHELGHMMADGELFYEEDAKISEIIAILTELTFGPLPRESLNTLLSFAWKSPWQIYRYAGQFILSRFIQQVEKEKDKGNLDFNEFYLTRSDRLIDKQRVIYNLSDIQIRQIAQAIYGQLYKAPLTR